MTTKYTLHDLPKLHADDRVNVAEALFLATKLGWEARTEKPLEPAAVAQLCSLVRHFEAILKAACEVSRVQPQNLQHPTLTLPRDPYPDT